MNSSRNRNLQRNGRRVAPEAVLSVRTGADDDREFDAVVARKLGEIEPPAGLRDAILAQAAAAKLAEQANRFSNNDE